MENTPKKQTEETKEEASSFFADMDFSDWIGVALIAAIVVSLLMPRTPKPTIQVYGGTVVLNCTQKDGVNLVHKLGADQK